MYPGRLPRVFHFHSFAGRHLPVQVRTRARIGASLHLARSHAAKRSRRRISSPRPARAASTPRVPHGPRHRRHSFAESSRVPGQHGSAIRPPRTESRNYRRLGSHVRLEPSHGRSVLNATYDSHLNFPLLVDRKAQLARALEVKAVPATFLIAADGTIVQTWQGLTRPPLLPRESRDCWAARSGKRLESGGFARG